MTTFDLLQLLGSMPIVRRRYSRSSLVVWGLPWERRVGKKETKSDLNHQEIVGARIRDCALPPPPPATTKAPPNAMGFPHYIDIAGAAFSACAAPIKEITSHTQPHVLRAVCLYLSEQKEEEEEWEQHCVS